MAELAIAESKPLGIVSSQPLEKKEAPGLWDRAVTAFGEFSNPLGDPTPGGSFDTRAEKIVGGFADIPRQAQASLQASGAAMRKGDAGAAAWHLVGAIPFLGPMTQQMSNDLIEGKWPEFLGHALAVKVMGNPETPTRVAEQVLTRPGETAAAGVRAVGEGATAVGRAVKTGAKAVADLPPEMKYATVGSLIGHQLAGNEGAMAGATIGTYIGSKVAGRQAAAKPPFVGPTIEQATAPAPVPAEAAPAATPVEAAPPPVEAPPRPVVAPEPEPAPPPVVQRPAPAPAAPVERWQPPTLEQRLEGLGPDTQRQILEKIGTPKAKELLAKLPPPRETPPAAPPTNLETLAATSAEPPAQGGLAALAGEPAPAVVPERPAVATEPPLAAEEPVPPSDMPGWLQDIVMPRKQAVADKLANFLHESGVTDGALEEIEQAGPEAKKNFWANVGKEHRKDYTPKPDTIDLTRERLRALTGEKAPDIPPETPAAPAAVAPAPGQPFTTVDDFVSRMRQSGGTADQARKWTPSTWKALGVPPDQVSPVISKLEMLEKASPAPAAPAAEAPTAAPPGAKPAAPDRALDARIMARKGYSADYAAKLSPDAWQALGMDVKGPADAAAIIREMRKSEAAGSRNVVEAPATPVAPSAAEYARIRRELSELSKRTDLTSGDKWDRQLDLEEQLRIHHPAAIAEAEAKIQREAAKVRPPSPSGPAATVPINRMTMNAADLAAEYKQSGMERTRAWSEFVKDRGLRPEMSAADFYKIYDSTSPVISRKPKSG